MYSEFARPAYFSGYECLHLNDGYADGTLDPVDQVNGSLEKLVRRTLSCRGHHRANLVLLRNVMQWKSTFPWYHQQ